MGVSRSGNQRWRGAFERRRTGARRRGRSGYDDRFCLQRDTGVHADADQPGPQADPPALPGAPQILGGSGPMTYLRPDGKSQVTVQYEFGKPVRVDTVVISTQHADYVDQEQIRQDVIEHIIKQVIPEHLLDKNTKIFVNPTGRFVTGGPMGDAGLTGRKIIVDTYGGMARHGGGAFSGKDPTKVDRSAAYAAAISQKPVAAGLADRIEIQVSYAIGVARPLSLFVDTFGTGQVSDEEIIRLINEHFDLRPAGIIQSLNLRRPIYQPTAAFGHFGRTDVDLPWEELNKVPMLRKGIGASVDSGNQAEAIS